MPALQAVLPASVQLNLAMDRSPVIKATLHEAEMTLLIAVALVILVVFLFLGNFRASLIPTLAVPVSLVGTFAIMYLYGFSLNNLSLMALILATGLVVDDAIVVLENVERIMVSEGLSPREATRKAMTQISGAIVGNTRPGSKLSRYLKLYFLAQDIHERASSSHYRR